MLDNAPLKIYLINHTNHVLNAKLLLQTHLGAPVACFSLSICAGALVLGLMCASEPFESVTVIKSYTNKLDTKPFFRSNSQNNLQ